MMLPAGDQGEVSSTSPWSPAGSIVTALEDGRNYRPKHVELIEIINKIIIVASNWLRILLIHNKFWFNAMWYTQSVVARVVCWRIAKSDVTVTPSVCWRIAESDVTVTPSVCWRIAESDVTVTPSVCWRIAESDVTVTPSVCWRIAEPWLCFPIWVTNVNLHHIVQSK